jgi:DNA helicase-2/ATP-dependent DNA helicase PcrA
MALPVMPPDKVDRGAYLLQRLNDRQREAVLHGDGPLLILAGAGSGKTRVLTHRVAHLVEARGVSPHAILAITFTNKAAKEMKERITGLIGDVRVLWVGTFHAICLRILRVHAEKVERTPSFSVYDSDDQEAVVKSCLKAFHLGDREYRPRVVHGQISRAKNNLVDHEAFEASAMTTYDRTVARLYREYDRRLREANAFDFDDLILRTIQLFRRDPEVLATYANRFRYVLVDEYQDTNHAQYVLISLLASGYKNLAVVGDDDQSIYGWRGADIGNILSYEESYPDATVIRLEQNYRSTKTILKAAHQVVSRNTGRKPKELWTENDAGEPIALWILPDEEQEAELIVRELRGAVERGEIAKYGDAVVLYRTHAQSRPLEAALRRQGIAYDLIGGISFYERREVKDILAYLRVIENPGDEVSLLRIINVPKRGIGDTSLERLLAFAQRTGISPRAAAGRLDEITELGGPARERLREFFALLDRLAADSALPAADRIARVVDATHYLDHLEEDEPDTASARRENLDELVAAAAHYAETTGDPTLAGFLAEVALVAQVDRMREETDRVTLMTAHNAKGLEFPLVFVAGLEQGLLPHASSVEEPRQLEEERRLFYVALTRAKQRIVLSAARERRRMGGIIASDLSDFVRDLPPELLDVHDLGYSTGGYGARRDTYGRGAYTSSAQGRVGRSVEREDGPAPGAPRRYRPEGGRGAAVRPPGGDKPERVVEFDPEGGSLDRAIGVWVHHPQFGRGVVVGQEGRGPDARLTVRFEGAVTKKVIARFLSLLDRSS